MINEIFDRLVSKGFGPDADGLESYVVRLQDAAGLGNTEVTDAEYDMYYSMLKQLKPDSSVLERNWEIYDYEPVESDEYLKKYGMRSINTITKLSELEYFKILFSKIVGNGTADFIAMFKLNGHAGRAVYQYGELTDATTRGRRYNGRGRSILRHAQRILPNYVEQWSTFPLVELRFESILPLGNFEQLRSVLKTPLSAVTSLIRESASDYEIDLLDMVCYQMFCDYIQFDSLGQKLDHLDQCGFNTCSRIVAENVSRHQINLLVDTVLSTMIDVPIEYDADGVVLSLNNIELFQQFGEIKNTFAGNLALKMGHWEANIYCATILEIEWNQRKSRMVPKAIIEPTITRNGATVRNVPLHNIGIMDTYKYFTGKEVYFRFGGETGVTLVSPDGIIINENS